jgi:hypothetical protein
VIIAAAATPAGPTQEDLLIQIRDLLKKRVPLHYMFHLTTVKGGFFVVTIVFCYLL